MTSDMSEFSVLLPTYDEDNPEYLDTAIKSVIKQTVRPNELVIVQDGPINDEITSVIQNWQRSAGTEVQLYRLERNQGLGAALRAGVRQCSYPLVARMDADDVSEPDRFERQLSVFQDCPKVDVVGGYIGEFRDDHREIESVRKVPSTHEGIAKHAKFRSPMNHGTVIFNREAVLNAGNYRPVDRMEDYGLWVRLLQQDAQFRNIPEVLVRVRAGEDLYHRRGGFEYAREELRLQWDFYCWGFISVPRLITNAALRTGLRLLPHQVRGAIYERFARESGSSETQRR